MNYSMSHLDQLESESIFILREIAANFSNPVLMFSGGKDSILLVHLTRKAFFPTQIPFKLLHVDTGHNFPETIEFRDELVKKLDLTLIVASVEDAINRGIVTAPPIHDPSRNSIQTGVLLDAIQRHQFDAAIGGARRDEEKARAKERIFSHRNKLGQWDPKNQRAELWNLFNNMKNEGEHFRVFPISNWTELDVWQYIAREKISLPSLYFSHVRNVINRDGILLADNEIVPKNSTDILQSLDVRCRTIGDITCTGLWPSRATTIEEIIQEIATTRITERGARVDDKKSDSSMEDRKKLGYF